MHERETADAIDDAASDWAARLDRGLTGDEQRALETWLGGDTRRVGALARARALWCHAAQAMGAPAATPRSRAAPSRLTRRSMLVGGLAAATAASVLLVTRWGDRTVLLESGVGEVRRITLEDGSAVTLGPGTRIRRRFDAAQRLIELITGDAFFEVAQDARRPFIVTAGLLTLRAVGTAFGVRAIETLPVSVIVAHGRVAVRGAGGGSRLLGPDMRLDMGASASPHIVRLEPDALQRALAWREGMLAFEGETLGAVVRQFDRYGRVRIEVADPALAREPITGLFAANDPRGFARAIAASLDARVVSEGDSIRLYRGGVPK